MIGRTKAILRNKEGGHIDTIIYIARGHQSPFGLKESKALGIVKITREVDNQEGIGTDMVNSLHKQQKTKMLMMSKQQELIGQRIEEIVEKFQVVESGIEGPY